MIERLIKSDKFAQDALKGIEEIWIAYPGWIKCAKPEKKAQ